MIDREPPVLMPLMLDAARAIGATVVEAAVQLSSSRFNAEVLSEAISGRTVGRRDGELPQHVAAAMLDGVPVLFGAIGEVPVKATVDRQMRRYRNQASIARSWLGTDAPNLQMFLAGPAGALRDPAWRQLAAEIEADDRICRKLVWLFEGEPTIENAKSFLQRTFIARPWPTQQLTKQLDSMANSHCPVGGRRQSKIPISTSADWWTG
jgi:hypothetical protein